MITLDQYMLSIVSGVIVGFSLGLIGGGGSILAVPLLLYFVGLSNMPNAAHIALGTTALAVGLNAFANSYMHLRKRNVAVKIGGVFAGVGVIGSLIGTYLGHITPGSSLLLYFAIAMIILGFYVGFGRNAVKAGTHEEIPRINESVSKCKKLTSRSLILVGLFGFVVGLVSGYFGIGGGFLIVPALMFSASLCISRAIGTSLISVGTFGLASGLLYLHYGDTIVSISLLYLIGGLLGGYIGTSLAVKAPKNTLQKAYGVIIVVVGIYMIFKVLHLGL
ncbi:MAG: sulfite exporter TauE/SafE family protein [Caldisphaera sp.]|uniref:sulfite exporter TauE/SafE family protein n=1 Tax=Caldisphaera sp. TaxID=2060322 RepID=UPI000CB7E8EC|nr:MAG: sulfite exporter TauE/SafE family protein [Caldisphaera sp.]PMP89143.1 MAG: sulfite exporter TauE/SafE family protein [Caldisphaera sp.]